MGSISFSKCVEDFESRLETNFESAVTSNQAILSAYSKMHEEHPDSQSDSTKLNPNLPASLAIKKIQATWRKYKSYKLLTGLKETYTHSSYFTKEDQMFTISQKFFTNSRKKKKIRYPKGHYFEGECKGGFRDGYGKMNWNDGCSYEGNWAFGYPEGYGKFVFFDKDYFEGKWVNPFPCVSQSINSTNKSFDTVGMFGDGFGKDYLAWLAFKQEISEYKVVNDIRTGGCIELDNFEC